MCVACVWLTRERERKEKKKCCTSWETGRGTEVAISDDAFLYTDTQFTLSLSRSHTHTDILVTVRGSDYPGEYRCANAIVVVLWSQLDQPDVSRRGRTELRAMCRPATQNGARTERIPTVFRGGPPPMGMTGQAYSVLPCRRYGRMYTDRAHGVPR